ncbi:MAG: hypothetical protein ACJAVV_002221 [Alphaproteobacteria bacterium]|jgi:hypothetical protein
MIIAHQTVHFWNGNKSETRRHYERQLLSLCLKEAGMLDAKIIVDEQDYPNAKDEGNIFSNNCDVLVTVAGNQKFLDKPAIIIEQAVCRGLLGHRLLIIPKEHTQRFAKLNSLEQLQKMTVGIPATWADADLFRHNGFTVSEKGSLDDLFARLLDKQFDYTALGANEVEAIFKDMNHPQGALLIEPTTLIYYPLPLVFYVHPDKNDLANAIERGLKTAIENGKHQSLFETYHPNLINRLNLHGRSKFQLANPYLPASLKDFCPTL